MTYHLGNLKNSCLILLTCILVVEIYFKELFESVWHELKLIKT